MNTTEDKKNISTLIIIGLLSLIIFVFLFAYNGYRISKVLILKSNGIVTNGIIVKTTRNTRVWGFYEYTVKYKYAHKQEGKIDSKSNVSYYTSSSSVTKDEFYKYALNASTLVTYHRENHDISEIGNILKKSYIDIIMVYKVDLSFMFIALAAFVITILGSIYRPYLWQ